MTTVSDPKKLGDAWQLQYERLALQFAELLPPGKSAIVEIGCGSGQMTVPLAKLIGDRNLIGVDRYVGPYSRDQDTLMKALSRHKLKDNVQVILTYGLRWLSDQKEGQYDAVISSEFLPELSSYEVEAFFSECHRVLKPGGMTIHSYLSPKWRNLKQKLTIDADSDTRWTRFPPKEWFSPPPRLASNMLKRAGFERTRTVALKSDLVVKAGAAKSLLSRWGVRKGFWDHHKKRLMKSGMELPDWIVMTGTKAPRQAGVTSRKSK